MITADYLNIWIIAAVLGAIIIVWAIFALRRRQTFVKKGKDVVLRTAADAEAASASAAMRVEKMIHTERESQSALGWSNKEERPASTEKSEYVLDREKTILIADDDPVVSLALSRRLERMGYQVLRTTDATHALFGVKKVQPDLAILDFEMPSGNGLAVCEMLACDRQCAGIPIIIHSVFTDESVKRRCRQLNAHYVQKSPHSWNEIRDLVEALLAPKKSASPEAEAEEGPAKESVVATEPIVPSEPQESPAQQERDGVPSEAATPEEQEDFIPKREPLDEFHVVSPWEHKPLTILCIDDDPVIIRSIAIRLQPYGIRVRGMDNGTQGYLSAVADPPDLILLDLKMPNGQGDYVISKLKDNPHTKDIPVIILTIESTSGVQRRMTSLGAESLVTKPVHWPDLFAHMGRCIQLPHKLLADYNLPEQLTVHEM